MAGKKKSILVETRKSGRSWIISVSANGEDLFQLYGSIVRNFADSEGLAMVNTTDPFPKSRARIKKTLEDLQDLKYVEAVIKS